MLWRLDRPWLAERRGMSALIGWHADAALRKDLFADLGGAQR